MKGLPFLLIPILFPLADTAAAEGAWAARWDGAFYGYLESTALQSQSVLNPGNRVAHLPQQSATLEGRFNFKADNDRLRLTFRPIVLAQQNRAAIGNETMREGYLSRWQLHLRSGEHWGLSAGRDLLTWGPAQFRSPSNPFYFDNGRSNPLRELSGMDTVKLSWTPDRERALHIAYISGSGHGAPNPDPWHETWLAKLDQRGEAWAAGLAVAKASGRAAFIGAHGQVTVNDALLLYGELGSSTRPLALRSPADATQPFTVDNESPRRTNALAGAQYTFDSGQSLSGEYLYHGHGFTSQGEQAYFTRAANTATPSSADIALGYAPPLLGRHYLHLVWQNSTLAEDGYWRLMLSRNLTDGATEVAGYGEAVLNRRVTAFALAIVPTGGAEREFSALLSRSLTVGLTIAVP